MDRDEEQADLVIAAANALNILFSELIVELVRSGALRETQAAKVLVRAEGFIDALRFHKDPEESMEHHNARLELQRSPVSSILEYVEARLALKPDIYVLRHRRRIVADGYRRNKAEERQRLLALQRDIENMLDELDDGEPLD